MYADRLEGGDVSKPSIKDRLNASLSGTSNSRGGRRITGKRQRQDDKWEHDLYERPQISRKIGGGDLRLKLQKKSRLQNTPVPALQDLRDYLSGTKHGLPVKKDPAKPKTERLVVKPVRKSVVAEAPVTESRKISNSTSRRKTQQKADSSVEAFLLSLGLEKYLITFQAEEVDMTALEHMTDEDLKALGIPMGPRKKIILALNSRG